MAALQTIRKHGVLMLIIIGFSLVLFIIPNSFWDWLKTMNRTTIAEIDGKKIDYNEFQKYETYHETYLKIAQNISSLSPEESEQVRQYAWNEILQNNLFFKKIEKTGLTISDEELEDMLFGTNIHQVILQNFTNPNTGQLDTAQIKQFFNNSESDQRMAVIADYFKTIIRNDALTNKYNTMIAKAFYTPTAIAKMDYIERNTQITFELLSKSYGTIVDDSIPVNDDEIKKYYESHKYQFLQEKESRDIEYVNFNILPSSSDTVAVFEEINTLYEEFNKLETGFAEFAVSNDDNRENIRFISEKNMPRGLPEGFFEQPDGTTSEILLSKNGFFFTKILESDIRPDSVQLQYIALVPNDTTTLEQCKHNADSLRALAASNQMDFQLLAYFNSADTESKQKGGDLGWFQDGTMRTDLNDFAFKGNIGDLTILDMQNSQGGNFVGLFKVSNMTEKSKKVKIATVNKEINPSNDTRNNIYGIASNFMIKSTNGEKFDSIVAADQLIKRLSTIGELDNKFSNINNAREIVRWAYNKENKVGTVSEVQEFIDKFIVVKIASIKPKGTLPLTEVTEKIKSEIIKNKKAEKLMSEMKNDLAQKGELLQLAQNPGYRYDTISQQNFASFGLPGYGTEPKVNGVYYAIPENTKSQLIQGNNGIYVLKVISKTAAPEKEEFSTEQLNIMQQNANQIYRIQQTIEKSAKINDYRAKFF
ncbi:MAG: SurA N-terminal domain-containing protein [Bacteroidales bacterium]|jgi:peptidyl-prolyl cis-trans isomerase D|nr:SurA N-terminal domain-containing protein [Bacteroidales bacterium]